MLKKKNGYFYGGTKHKNEFLTFNLILRDYIEREAYNEKLFSENILRSERVVAVPRTVLYNKTLLSICSIEVALTK